MSDTVIKVENLSKSGCPLGAIRHQSNAPGGRPYTALRDVLTNGATHHSPAATSHSGRGFHPELTGRESIYLNGAILGMSRSAIRRQVDEIVAFAPKKRG